MRFWDSSALVPLLLEEPNTSIVAWWGTSVECTAALALASRDHRIDQDALAMAIQRLDAWSMDWTEVDGTAPLRALAERLVRTHPLRAGDALQLAAALTAAEGMPATLPFVTGDARLADAAFREGFPVIRFVQP